MNPEYKHLRQAPTRIEHITFYQTLYVQKFVPWEERANMVILTALSTGLIEYAKSRNIVYIWPVVTNIKEELKPMQLVQVYVPFLILAVGYVLGFIIMIGERIRKKSLVHI